MEAGGTRARAGGTRAGGTVRVMARGQEWRLGARARARGIGLGPGGSRAGESRGARAGGWA